MNFGRKSIAALTLAIMAGAMVPALAQNPFMDRAKESAARRAENKAIREAEHPEPEPAAQTANAAKPVAPEVAPAAPAEAAAAPVAPAEAAPAAAAAPAPAK